MLAAEPSAELRDRLLGELNDLADVDEAALWAQRCLPQKNRLTADDAQRVEEGFKARLANFGPVPPVEPEPTGEALTPRLIARRPTGRNLQNKANCCGAGPMTSVTQIEANRRNALKSTGPRTEAGKQVSRGNAVRHGLTAETVIGALEDAADRTISVGVDHDYVARGPPAREAYM